MSAEHPNSRVASWLKATGLSVESIARPSGEDIPFLTMNGHRLPWTVHYSEWVMARLTEWGKSLGFGRAPRPHEEAFLCGHTHDEFDAWLETWSSGNNK